MKLILKASDSCSNIITKEEDESIGKVVVNIVDQVVVSSQIEDGTEY